MTELYEKSLRKLELDNVLAQLADHASSSEDGKGPLPRPAGRWTTRRTSACSRQQTTRGLRHSSSRKGAPGFRGLVARGRASLEPRGPRRLPHARRSCCAWRRVLRGGRGRRRPSTAEGGAADPVPRRLSSGS